VGLQDRIYHVDCKDAKRQVGNGRNGRMGSHLAVGRPARGWDFVSTGHGDVPWEACFRMLNTIGYDGPDLGGVGGRRHGPPGRRAEALAFVRRLAFDPPSAAFDAAFILLLTALRSQDAVRGRPRAASGSGVLSVSGG
jgi:hypothetical protein